MTISASNHSINRYEESFSNVQKMPKNSINSLLEHSLVKKEPTSIVTSTVVKEEAIDFSSEKCSEFRVW